jgi:hypothetical protein
MADAVGVNSALPTRVGGISSSSGLPDYFADVTSIGQLKVTDGADGPVTPGTAAGSSILIGGQYNSTLPTLTTAQQSAVQVDSNGRLLVSSIANALPAGTNNIGSVTLPQTTATGSLSVLNAAVTFTLAGQSNITFQLAGTWTATVTFEASNDNANWTTIYSYRAGDNTIASSITNSTNNDIYRVTVASFGYVRARVSAYTSGTVVVTAFSSWTTSSFVLNTSLPGGTNNIGSVNQGTSNTLVNAWAEKLTDGTNGPVAVKPANTAPLASDPALVVTLSPNSSSLGATTGNGTISALNGAVSTVAGGAVTWSMSGTWVGTLTTQAQNGDGQWWNVASLSNQTGILQNTTSQNGVMEMNAAGWTQVRIVATAWTSGTATVTFASTAGSHVLAIYSSNATNMQATAYLNDGAGNSITSTTVNTKQLLDVDVPDLSGTGTIAALNGSVALSTQGRSNVAVNVTGTWVATLTIQATVDGTTWFAVDGLINSTGIDTTTLTSNNQVLINCGGYSQIRLTATSYTSGTASIAYDAGIGANIVNVYNPTASALNAQVVGNVASGSADSGNGVKVSAVAVTNIAGLPSVSSGNRVDNQADLNGRLYVTNAPQDGAKTTYSATATGLVPGSTPTDIFTITGSSTKTIRVTDIKITATQATVAAIIDILLVKRSAANSGGTSTAATAVSHDSSSAAATATVLAYTANPTSLGAAVGTIRSTKMVVTVASPGTAQAAVASFPVIWDFGNRPSQAIVLRGTAQVLAINLNAVSLGSTGSFDIHLEWSEE